MSTEVKAPSSRTSSTGHSPAMVVGDVTGDDGSWAVANGNNTNTDIHVAMANPSPTPTVGAGLQTLSVMVRRTAGSGSVDPTARLELWVNGGGAAIQTSGDVTVTSDTSQTISFTFNANTVSASCDDLEVKVFATKSGGSLAKRSAVDTGYIWWDVDYSAAAAVIVANDSLNAHSVDNAVLTAHSPIVIQESAHASLADNLTLTASSGSSTADLGIAYSPKANWAVIELGASVTKGSDSAFTSTVEAVPSTSQAYYPTANSVAISASGIVTGTPELDIDFQWWDSSSSTWKQETYPVILQIVTNDSDHTSSVDNVVATAHSPIVANEGLITHSADNQVLTAHSPITMNESLHVHTGDNQTLTAHSPIVIAESAHGSVADNLTLTELPPTLTVVIQEGLHSTVADNATLTAHSPIVLADSLHGSVSDNVALTGHSPIVIAESSHAHSVDNLVITYTSAATSSVDQSISYNPKASWAVQEITSAVKTADVSIFQDVVEAVPDASQAYYPTTDSTSVSATGVMTTSSSVSIDLQWWNSSSSTWKQLTWSVSVAIIVNDSAHASTVDNVGLTGHSPVVIAESLHAHAADNLALTAHSQIVIEENLHSSVADNVTATAHTPITVAENLHVSIADNATLTAHSPIIANESTHSHSADNLTVIHNAPTGTVVVAEGLHSHTADNVTAIAHSPIVIAESLHSHAIDNLTLAETPPSSTMVIAESLHSHTADNVTVTNTSSADRNITYSAQAGWEVTEVSGVTTGIVGTYFENFTGGSVIDGSQIYSPDTVSYTATGVITTSISTDTVTQFWDKSDATWKQVTLLVKSIHSASHSTTSDNLTLTTSFNPVVAESLHTHTVPNLTLITNNAVIVSNPTHSHSVPQLTIVARSPKVIAQATHVTSADVVVLTAHTPIVINSLAHGHTADVLRFVTSNWTEQADDTTVWTDGTNNGTTWNDSTNTTTTWSDEVDDAGTWSDESDATGTWT